ncbi:MAG: DNA-processing protein DprA [Thermodesulfovibrio sp.]|nr:DNA-processing protein DprA [Thermodesulfovibrio sp.]
MNKEEIRHILALLEIKDLGSVSIRKIIQTFGSAIKVFYSEPEEIASLTGIKLDTAKKIKSFSNWQKIDDLTNQCEKKQIKILSINDESYPQLLKEIYDPPVVLFCKGMLLPQDNFGLAVVGSRQLSDYGKRVTEKFAFELASCGITIVSGLARGIDSVAHLSALSAQGRTIAVLGSGILKIYPPENKKLSEQITQRGAILSEFYPETPPKRENFPKRNRIISGMTVGTLVTEATTNSGALITAKLALEQGREVFAVPGNITSKNSEGTNFLIKKGAKLVQKIEDILEEIKPFIPSLKESFISLESTIKVDLTDEENAIFSLLDRPLNLDEIVINTELSISRILEILLKLEIKGLITRFEGKYVRRI